LPCACEFYTQPAPRTGIALRALAEVLKRELLEVVRFVLYKQSHLDAFRAELERLTEG
jgi:hypothetical protein